MFVYVIISIIIIILLILLYYYFPTISNLFNYKYTIDLNYLINNSDTIDDADKYLFNSLNNHQTSSLITNNLTDDNMFKYILGIYYNNKTTLTDREKNIIDMASNKVYDINTFKHSLYDYYNVSIIIIGCFLYLKYKNVFNKDKEVIENKLELYKNILLKDLNIQDHFIFNKDKIYYLDNSIYGNSPYYVLISILYILNIKLKYSINLELVNILKSNIDFMYSYQTNTSDYDYNFYLPLCVSIISQLTKYSSNLDFNYFKNLSIIPSNVFIVDKVFNYYNSNIKYVNNYSMFQLINGIVSIKTNDKNIITVKQNTNNIDRISRFIYKDKFHTFFDDKTFNLVDYVKNIGNYISYGIYEGWTIILTYFDSFEQIVYIQKDNSLHIINQFRKNTINIFSITSSTPIIVTENNNLISFETSEGIYYLNILTKYTNPKIIKVENNGYYGVIYSIDQNTDQFSIYQIQKDNNIFYNTKYKILKSKKEIVYKLDDNYFVTNSITSISYYNNNVNFGEYNNYKADKFIIIGNYNKSETVLFITMYNTTTMKDGSKLPNDKGYYYLENNNITSTELNNLLL